MSDVRHAAMWSEVLNSTDRQGATFVAEDDEAGIVGFADCAPAREDPDEDPEDDDDEGGAATKEPAEEAGSISVIVAMLADALPGGETRRRIGRGFVANAARHLAACEYDGLIVWVLQDDPARTFYEKLGGDACALREIQFIDTTLMQVCYQWIDISELMLIDMMG